MPPPPGFRDLLASRAGRRIWLGVPPAVAAAASLGQDALPGGSLAVFALASLLWLIAAGVWLAFAVRLVRAGNPAVLLTPVLAVATYGATTADLPIRAVFAASEPALAAYVESLPVTPEESRGAAPEEQGTPPAEEESKQGLRLVGYFPVLGATRYAGSAHLNVPATGGPFSRCGLTHLSGDEITEFRASPYLKLSDDWYAVCEDF